ncbi:hypothetical protein GPZ80_18530 [Actinokineospora sp. HBU206404]|uniref:Lipoprotein n=2 Tax=Actinokineospora xionganensis TaxID=2684470 RepID=A0ABR7L9T7_9PSEU|nr:hypothetical protein [Actinokineospora xionganensis]
MSSGTAAAADPIVVGSCGASIQGTPGQPVALSPSALLSPITNVLNSLPLVKVTLAPLVNGVLASMGPIPIGALPNGSGTIGGSSIGGAVTNALAGTALAPIANAVGSAMASGCTVLVKGVNTVVAPVQEGSKAVAGAVEKGAAALPLPGNPTNPTQPPGTTNPGAPDGGQGNTDGGNSNALPGSNQPVSGGVPSAGGLFFSPNYSFGRSPMADYSNLPFAKAGLFAPSPGVRYGGGVPGYSPQFGILGTNNDTDGVQAAGHADALTPIGGNRIAFPILLAVLALSGVTAALVRTWVLRRMTA